MSKNVVCQNALEIFKIVAIAFQLRTRLFTIRAHRGMFSVSSKYRGHVEGAVVRRARHEDYGAVMNINTSYDVSI